MSKLAIYIRKSAETEGSKSLHEQEQLGTEFAIANNFEFKIYSEGIKSGSGESAKRPVYTHMLADIDKGLIHGVFIWDSSRANRDFLSTADFLNKLRDNNCLLYDNGVKSDLNDPNTYIFYGMKGLMDNHFSLITSTKITSVVNRNAREGKSHGILPYGFKNENGNLIIDEEEAEVIRTIFNLQLKGWGQQRISNYLNEQNIPTRKNKLGTKPDAIWESGTIFRILKNKLYMGKRQWKGKEFDVEPIIDPLTFEQVQQNRKANRTRSGAITEHKYLLYQTMRCAECGSNLAIRSHKGKPDYSYYTCTGNRNKKINCKAKPIKQAPIEEFIWERFFLSDTLVNLVKTSLDHNNIGDNIKKFEGLGQGLQSQLATIATKRKNAVRLVIDGVLTDEDAKAEIDRLDREKLDTELKIGQNLEHLEFLRDSGKKQKEITEDLQNLKTNTSFNKKRELVSKYIKKISIMFIDPWFSLGVAFNILELPLEMYMMDKKYQFAIDVDNRIYVPLSDKLKNTVIPEDQWEEITKGMDKLLDVAYQRKFN
ncbi:MAG: recombinase family protein [Arenibacter troitsensis]|nr:recombinase family protein [Arenibacter troitsensis]